LVNSYFKSSDGCFVRDPRYQRRSPSFLNSISPQTLLAGGADPDYGSPSAMEAIVLFKQEEKWRAKFEAAPGRGKGRDE
jgi:hypothetical protein